MQEDTINTFLNSKKSYPEKILILKKNTEKLINKDFDESLKLTELSIKFAKKNNDKIAMAEFIRQKGNAHYFKGNYDSCTKYYFKSLEILEKEHASEELAKVHNDLGRFNRKIKNFSRALQHYDKAMSIYTKQNDAEGIATIYNESGVVFEYMKDYREAVNRYLKSYEIQKQRNDLVGQGYALEFIGGAYIAQKKYKEAEDYLLQSLEIRKKTKDQFATALNYNVLGNLFNETRNVEKAEQNYIRSNKIAQNMGYLDLMAGNYQSLSKLYEKSGNYEKAFSNLNLYKKLNDSIFSLGKAKQIEELSVKYETVEKDREIIQNKNKLFKRNVTIFSLLGLLSMGMIYYRNFRHRKKIEFQKEILHQQELAANAVMTAEDSERKRMAIHLHDGVAQLLGAAAMNVSALEDFKEDASAFNKIMKKAQDIIGEAIADVRTLSHQMMPGILNKNTITEALNDLAEKSSSQKLHINIETNNLPDNLEDNIKIILYRTVQECLNNIIKHANAALVDISVISKNESIFAEITDNGKGFHSTQESTGIGLQNMKSRIELMKGNFSIQSKIGEGTTVKFDLPITKHQ